MLYEYTKTQLPCMKKMYDDVAASAMTDKGIEWCNWEEDEQKLTINFTNTLSTEDETILDGIVAACPVETYDAPEEMTLKNGDKYIGFKSPEVLTEDTIYVLPEDGVDGQALFTNGEKNLSFQTIPSLPESVTNRIKNNIILNSFRTAITMSLSVFKMIKGIVDVFTDESGIDTEASVDEVYDADGDYYESLGSYWSNVLTGGTATADSYFASDIPGKAFDGNTGTKWTTDTLPNSWLKYDLGTGNSDTPTKLKLFILQTGQTGLKDFELYGSNNDSDWTLLTSEQYPNEDGWHEFNFANTTAYRYFRLNGISLNWNNDKYISVWEMELHKMTSGADMTLISDSVEAEAEPTEGKIVILLEEIDSVILNTNLKAYVSLDDGANYDQITLEYAGMFNGTKKIIVGSGDLTDRDDKTMRWKLVCDTSKLKIHATSLSWE